MGQFVLADMERAEDLFHAYGVAFNPHVLAVHRLHILRRFGRTLAAQSATRADVARDADTDRVLVAEALGEAHAYFAAGGAAELVPSRHGGAPDMKPLPVAREEVGSRGEPGEGRSSLARGILPRPSAGALVQIRRAAGRSKASS